MIRTEKKLCIAVLLIALFVVIAMCFAVCKADAADKQIKVGWTAGNATEKLAGFEIEYSLNNGEYTSIGDMIPINAEDSTAEYLAQATITLVPQGVENLITVRVRAVGDASYEWTEIYSDWAYSDTFAFTLPLDKPDAPLQVLITLVPATE